MLSQFIATGFIFAIWLVIEPRYAQKIAILSTAVSWIFFIKISSLMNFNTSGLQLVETFNWIPNLHIQWFLALDNLSWMMCGLTLVIHTIVLASIVQQSSCYMAGYLALFLVLQSMTLGVFMAFDAMLFYIFWEGMLIPMYLCISGFGSEEASKAAMKFFLFTFVGSLLMLLGFLYIGIAADSFDIVDWVVFPLSFNEQVWLFLCLLPSFAIKIPMFPFHTWLPTAHTEAPTEGSVILAALMLKVGAYGVIRILMPVLPDASRYFSSYMIVLSLIAIIYVGMVAYSQRDIKKLIAYSSISHMGFVTLGLFLIYYTDLKHLQIMLWVGAVVQMMTHAFGSGALFLSFGMLYAKVKKRDIDLFSGLYTQIPWFSFFFMLFVFSTIGVPATAGFVGEWIIIVSAVMINFKIGLLALLGMAISAGYLLNLVRQICFHKPSLAVGTLEDINFYQGITLGVLALAIVVIGIYPFYLFKILQPSLTSLVKLALASKMGAI